MGVDEKYLKSLFDETRESYDVGGYDNFRKMITTDAKFRKSFYEDASHSFELGASFDEFETTIGLKKKDVGGLSASASTSPSASAGSLKIPTNLVPMEQDLSMGEMQQVYTDPRLADQKASLKQERDRVITARKAQQMTSSEVSTVGRNLMKNDPKFANLPAPKSEEEQYKEYVYKHGPVTHEAFLAAKKQESNKNALATAADPNASAESAEKLFGYLFIDSKKNGTFDGTDAEYRFAVDNAADVVQYLRQIKTTDPGRYKRLLELSTSVSGGKTLADQKERYKLLNEISIKRGSQAVDDLEILSARAEIISPEYKTLSTKMAELNQQAEVLNQQAKEAQGNPDVLTSIEEQFAALTDEFDKISPRYNELHQQLVGIDKEHGAAKKLYDAEIVTSKDFIKKFPQVYKEEQDAQTRKIAWDVISKTPVGIGFSGVESAKRIYNLIPATVSSIVQLTQDIPNLAYEAVIGDVIPGYYSRDKVLTEGIESLKFATTDVRFYDSKTGQFDWMALVPLGSEQLAQMYLVFGKGAKVLNAAMAVDKASKVGMYSSSFLTSYGNNKDVARQSGVSDPLMQTVFAMVSSAAEARLEGIFDDAKLFDIKKMAAARFVESLRRGSKEEAINSLKLVFKDVMQNNFEEIAQDISNTAAQAGANFAMGENRFDASYSIGEALNTLAISTLVGAVASGGGMIMAGSSKTAALRTLAAVPDLEVTLQEMVKTKLITADEAQATTAAVEKFKQADSSIPPEVVPDKKNKAIPLLEKADQLTLEAESLAKPFADENKEKAKIINEEVLSITLGKKPDEDAVSADGEKSVKQKAKEARRKEVLDQVNAELNPNQESTIKATSEKTSVKKVAALQPDQVRYEGYEHLKEVMGEKDARKYFSQVDRLVKPYLNDVAEYRQNGVVIREGKKFVFRELIDMDSKQWRLSELKSDVTDQFKTNGKEKEAQGQENLLITPQTDGRITEAITAGIQQGNEGISQAPVEGATADQGIVGGSRRNQRNRKKSSSQKVKVQDESVRRAQKHGYTGVEQAVNSVNKNLGLKLKFDQFSEITDAQLKKASGKSATVQKNAKKKTASEAQKRAKQNVSVVFERDGKAFTGTIVEESKLSITVVTETGALEKIKKTDIKNISTGLESDFDFETDPLSKVDALLGKGTPVESEVLGIVPKSVRVMLASSTRVGTAPASDFMPSAVRDRIEQAAVPRKVSMVEAPLKMMRSFKDGLSAFFRQFKELSEKKFAKEIDILRRMKDIGNISYVRANQYASKLFNDLSMYQRGLLRDFIILDDLLGSVENGLFDGVVIRKNLPFGIQSKAELKRMHAEAKARVDADPMVLKKLEWRTEFLDALYESAVKVGVVKSEPNLNGRSYFHRQILRYREEEQFRNALKDTANLRKKTPGQFKQREGSSEDYYTNLAETDFTVVATSIHEVERRKLIAQLVKPYKATMAKFKKAATAAIDGYLEHLESTYGEDSDEFNEAFANKADLIYNELKGMLPEGWTIYTPSHENVFFKTQMLRQEYVEQLLDQLDMGLSSFAKAFNDIQNNLVTIVAMGKKPSFAMPVELASYFERAGQIKVEDDSAIGKAQDVFKGLNTLWKKAILLNPFRLPRYLMGNFIGDTDRVLATDTGIAKWLPKAASVVMDYYTTGQTTAELDMAIRMGVVSSGSTIKEFGEVNSKKWAQYLSSPKKNFDFESAVKSLGGKALNSRFGIKTYFNIAGKIASVREDVFRMAAYMRAKERLNKGDVFYWGSNKSAVEVLGGEEKAAKLAREVFGDYGAVSEGGENIAKFLLPFYRFRETNIKFYKNFIANGFSDPGQLPKVIRMGLTRGITKAATFSLVNYSRMVLFTALVQAWNYLMFPDEEEEMRRNGIDGFHLILGRNEDGSVRTIRALTTFGSFLESFGVNGIIDLLAGYENKEVTVGEVLKSPAKAFTNELYNGLTPIIKSPFELSLGKSGYPDVFRMKSIPNRGKYIAQAFGLQRPYDLITGDPHREMTFGEAMGATVSSDIDVKRTAYYMAKNIVQDYKGVDNSAKVGGSSSKSAIDEMRRNAIRKWKEWSLYGNAEKANKELNKAYELGAKRGDIKRSIDLSDPLYGLDKAEQRDVMNMLKGQEPKTEFGKSLDAKKLETFRSAIHYYQMTYKKGMSYKPTPLATEKDKQEIQEMRDEVERIKNQPDDNNK